MGFCHLHNPRTAAHLSLVLVVDGVEVEVRRVSGDTAWSAPLPATRGIFSVRQDPEGVGVAETTLPSLDSHDGGVRLDDAELEGVGKTVSDPVVDINLPCSLGHTSGLGVVNGVDTSRQV